jgi:hypothetical protein
VVTAGQNCSAPALSDPMNLSDRSGFPSWQGPPVWPQDNRDFRRTLLAGFSGWFADAGTAAPDASADKNLSDEVVADPNPKSRLHLESLTG